MAHPGLGRAVRRHARRGLDGVQRGDGDDRARSRRRRAWSCVRGRHRPGRLLDREEHPGQAQVDDALPLLERLVDDGGVGAGPGVGDGDVEPAEPRHGGIAQRRDLGLVGDVGDQRRTRPGRARRPRASRPAASMSPSTTRAPSATKRRAIPRPMPDAAPVMTATLSSRRPGTAVEGSADRPTRPWSGQGSEPRCTLPSAVRGRDVDQHQLPGRGEGRQPLLRDGTERVQRRRPGGIASARRRPRPAGPTRDRAARPRSPRPPLRRSRAPLRPARATRSRRR